MKYIIEKQPLPQLSGAEKLHLNCDPHYLAFHKQRCKPGGKIHWGFGALLRRFLLGDAYAFVTEIKAEKPFGSCSLTGKIKPNVFVHV